ncbi:Arp complex subunit [Suhomyces tanzawaensis NRRL Y-17324]|uniref:Arp2/3 complex 34 kDa subunit n=1 Tax=Suhomyces tanzawaensis NRRL Y-17324 TaxID=984487 RepID=A0A1E4SPR2_9ASCO|nr:Arp complex subunit [Suhomyces tanzawaensis NRRL Y-17324]ODV81382.1 Arp complex subunit [Suhomyces tanzawaensis NRRL Y-17324]
MLHIEQNNLLIKQTLTDRVLPAEEGLKSLDRIITDFDFTTYHISTLPDNKQLILISIYLKCWDDLVKYGVVEYLNSKYGLFEGLTILLGDQIEPSYNYSLVLDLGQVESQAEELKLDLVEQLSFLKRNAMASAFEQAFARYDELAAHYATSNTYSEEIQAELQNEEVLVIKYRGSDESIYIKPSFDRVTVVFSTVFQDETDKIFGKVFLQEFVDARKRSVQTAPQVLYSHKEAPLDIQSAVQGSRDDEKKGYITFVLFPRHLVKGDRRENCISHIQFFRNYFHYHIKCSKAYMHSRMRFRVKEFLKILNRAKPENVDEEGKVIENRKTASGRRFVA